MVCLSIGNIDFDLAFEALKGVALAEIRMDLAQFNSEQYVSIFEHHKNLIATCRSGGYEQNVVDSYKFAIDSGCAFVDIDNEELGLHEVLNYAKRSSSKVIISYHNYSYTPDSVTLHNLLLRLQRMDADIIKLACMANSPDDCTRMLNLYDNNTNLVAFCMGALGRKTRFIAPILGAPFTYASIPGFVTAPGQADLQAMWRLQ